MRVHRLLVAGAVALVASLPVGVAAAASSDTSTRVSVGSPRSLFSQNKQNEPGLALDAYRPNVLVAGSNDEIDMEACNAGGPTSCPFTPGVGVSGSISPSIPVTTGHNRPTRAGPPGIDLDRAPAPHMLGRSGPCENISRMAWRRTDNAASSPFFGNVYVCNVRFRSTGGAPGSVKIHRSTIDGVAGSRTDVFPSINIANGAPSGIGAPDTIVLGWSDNRAGLNNERAYVNYFANRGASGDARGSSANSLTAEFLGDYNYAVASNTDDSTVWNDVWNATDCPAVDAFRQSLAGGSSIPTPSLRQTPFTAFGDTEVFGWTSAP